MDAAFKARLIDALECAAEKLDIADGIIDPYQDEDSDSTEPFSQQLTTELLTLARDLKRL